MTMTYTEIETALQQLLRPEAVPYDAPTDADWQSFESRYGCHLGDEFKAFIALMSKYQFPGDILNVSSGRTNRNDSISVAYQYELQGAGWDAKMLPFYAIGNGDYFCLNSLECPDSRVFYYYAETQVFKPYCDSFEQWIQALPEFLA